MTDDDEINAMKVIAGAMTPLEESARDRVLQWALSRFRSSSAASVASALDHASADRNTSQSTGPQQFETFADLFEAAHPATDKEKALVAAYWAQVCDQQVSFGSQTLNDALKDLGHGVGNITDALTSLKEERPALILQLKKSGTSKQARKTYKLTQEGIRRIQTMVRGELSTEAA